MYSIIVAVSSLVLILASSIFFTNAVEWLGISLNVKEGAVGSLLAALGTALPEIMIPVVAIVFGTKHETGISVGVGAILGAPFMLSTAAFAAAGAASLLFGGKRRGCLKLQPDAAAIKRDLGFFLPVYAAVILSTFLPRVVRLALLPLLVAAYVGFVCLVLSRGKPIEGHNTAPLFLARAKKSPPLFPVLVQLFISFAALILGVHTFVDLVESLAGVLHLPVLLFSLLVAPAASEMPELFNSVLWIGQGKDTLALGNITGAMVLQSSIVPVLGLALTPWKLPPVGLASAGLALLASFLVYWHISRKGSLSGVFMLVMGSMFYLSFLLASLMFSPA